MLINTTISLVTTLLHIVANQTLLKLVKMTYAISPGLYLRPMSYFEYEISSFCS